MNKNDFYKLNKLCHGCSRILDISSFSKSKTRKDGLQTRCKKCLKEYKDKWLKDFPEKQKQSSKKWYEKNRDELLLKQAEYRNENKEKINLTIKKWQQSERGKEKTYLTHKRQIAKNPEKARARWYLATQIKRNNLEKPSECSVCKKESNRIEGHHLCYKEPLNVLWLCKKCHTAIHKKGGVL